MPRWMFNIVAVVRTFHEFGDALDVLQSKAARGVDTTVDMHRLKSRFRRLALAMGYELRDLSESNVVYARFGGADDDRPGAA